MTDVALQRPGVVWGSYPERDPRAEPLLDRWNKRLQRRFAVPHAFAPRHNARFVAAVRAAIERLEAAPQADRTATIAAVVGRLHREGFTDTALAGGMGLVACTTAAQLRIEPYDAQILAARIMLHGGLAEMATGEGKTIAALLVAATAGLAGVPVHVLSANDYLVARDAAALRPVYEALGLTLGVVVERSTVAERRTAYACNVAYCTARELAFDYLRDRLMGGALRHDLEHRAAALGAGDGNERVLRGLCMAVVDEADSILIDDARTPLIIARPRASSPAADARLSRQALTLAGALRAGEHFVIDPATRVATLNDEARAFLARRSRRLGAPWDNPRRGEELVSIALQARHGQRRDVDYIVRDGEILIVDPNTGRVADGRRWSRGLHQMVELKEGCKPNVEHETAAQITYQRLFPRYHRLCGMTGTAAEARGELLGTYGLHVTRVAPRTPSRRVDLGTQVFATTEARWRAVIERITARHAAGQPVMVGTGSVSESEELSRRLAAAGLPHEVLNARQDSAEAAIVARAGEVGRITVATNIAGRGTDIRLGPGVAERGGLHIICSHANAERRIDRQLKGRCARQGDPGSCEVLLSLEDATLSHRLPAPLRTALARLADAAGTLPARIAPWIAAWPQWLEESAARALRRQVAHDDEQWARRMTFGGRGE
jgi:preprotein translocase subunit SecA